MSVYIAGVGAHSINRGLDFDMIAQILQCDGFITLPHGECLGEYGLLNFDVLALAPGYEDCPEAVFLYGEAQRLGRIVFKFDENGFYE